MSKNLYLAGLNVLGTPRAIFQRTRFGADEAQAILIQVRNAAQLARSQGTLVSLVQSIAPVTIEKKVNDQISSELSKALREKGVDASVTLVNPASYKAVSKAPVAAYAAVGVTGLVAGGLLLAFVKRKKFA